MIDDTRGWISLFLGIIVTAFGALPLLHDFGIINFDFLNSIPLLIIAGLMVVGAVFLFIDSIHEDHLKWISIIIGFVILVLGVVPLLFKFGIIATDFTSAVLAISIIKNIVLIAAGVLLMLGSGD